MNVQSKIDQLLPLAPPPARPRSRKRLRLAVLALAGMAAAFLAARYLYPHTVQGEVLRPGGLVVELGASGTLTALSEAAVGSRIQARIDALAVDRNDRVRRGDVLARLSVDDLTGNLAAAEATAHASERAVNAASAERERASAALDKARATHERQVALSARGVASQAALDDALAAFRQSEADLVRTSRAIEQAEAERDAARARIAVARAQLDDSVLRAPISGIVVSRDHQLGDMLTPGETVLRIVDPASLVLTARLDESAISAIRPGQRASVTFGRTEHAIAGHVLRLGREVDVETREFELDIALERLPENWAIGQRGTARVTVSERDDVLSVPQSYLARRDGVPGIWVMDGGRARWRSVTLGAAGRERVEVTQGLTPGDAVLAPSGIYPFMRVRLAGGAAA
ncbi:efflux RND transporter periplasmic adaptor subunit [Bosea sp. 117]|uniref:efflux RND transporter periplasmic adaptor subunit n=1 Tax=Bosea sp. 117 TaxID=1125973 RepID=UPI0009DD91F4|nr:efflux RND transporter periplasmic adaptor subunit [Bosea sp. 117]